LPRRLGRLILGSVSEGDVVRALLSCWGAGAKIWVVFSELLPDALEKASANLVAVVVRVSVVAMVALRA